MSNPQPELFELFEPYKDFVFYESTEDLIDKCVERKSFEQSTISSLIDLDEVGLLYREDIKNMQGKEQRNEIYRYLKNSLLREVPEQNEYKF